MANKAKGELLPVLISIIVISEKLIKLLDLAVDVLDQFASMLKSQIISHANIGLSLDILFGVTTAAITAI